MINVAGDVSALRNNVCSQGLWQNCKQHETPVAEGVVLKKKKWHQKKRPSQIVTAENTCSRLFPKCFFFFFFLSGAQTFWLDDRLYPEVFPQPAYISQSRRDGWIEICRAWVETTRCAVGGPLWQIYNRWYVLQWARFWSTALPPYLPLWLHNCLAEMLCRTRLASPALNSSLSSLLSTTDSLHLSFLTNLKHTHTHTHTQTCSLAHSLTHRKHKPSVQRVVDAHYFYLAAGRAAPSVLYTLKALLSKQALLHIRWALSYIHINVFSF